MGNDNLASLASLSCFSQNSNTYNETVTLKLNTMNHFDKVFPVIRFFL